MAKTHFFPKEKVHYTWNTSQEPELRISSGDTVVYETRDVSDGQFYPGATTADVANLDWNRVYPLSGPVYVDGAEPGDILEVEVLDLHPLAWGWTAVLPGLGLLADDFPDAYLRTFDLSNGEYIPFREDVQIPFHPFFGTMGVCPENADGVPIMPPGNFGGNMDTRQLTIGTKLYLPVQERGALFSCGDAHAAQGDGEVCVTGLECPMYGSLRFKVHKGRTIRFPEYLTPISAKLYRMTQHYGTTGVGADLMEASKDALRGMIDYVSTNYDMSREDAYLLSSLCVNLQLSEVVDAGQYVVSAVIPLDIFKSRAY